MESGLRLLLLLSAVVALGAARPAEADSTKLQPAAGTASASSPGASAAEPSDGADTQRGKRQILFQTSGYPGLVYPGYYPGYFDLRYPGLSYPAFPALTAYPAYPGYPLLFG